MKIIQQQQQQKEQKIKTTQTTTTKKLTTTTKHSVESGWLLNFLLVLILPFCNIRNIVEKQTLDSNIKIRGLVNDQTLNINKNEYAWNPATNIRIRGMKEGYKY